MYVEQNTRRELAAVSRRLDEREHELQSLRRRHKAEMRELQEQLRATDDARLQRHASSDSNRGPRAQDENFDAETYRRMTHAERKLERVLAEREQLLAGVKKMKALVAAQTEEIHALKVKVHGTAEDRTEGVEVPAWVQSLGVGQVASPAASGRSSVAGADLRANYAVLKEQYRDAREQANQASNRIEALERELGSMTQRLARQQLRDSSDRVVSVPHGAGTAVDELLQDKARLQGELRALENEAQRLKSDNRRLKKELSAFDPAFFKVGR